MKSDVLYILTGLLGLTLGGVSALWVSGLLGASAMASFATINVSGWKSDPSIGAPSANAYTRARIARHGLLALAKEEAIYFTRNTDDAGDLLRESCQYELKGGPQAALWWSITLYDADSRLPLNTDNHLSLDATTLGNQDTWTATIAPNPPPEGHWLSSRAAGQFDLTLRLYQPASDVIETPETRLSVPEIRRITCEAGS